MLNKFTSRLLLQRSSLLTQQARNFAAISQQTADHAHKDPQHFNWSKITPADIHDSDPLVVGKLMGALAYAHEDQSSLQAADTFEEYFRKRFRQLDSETALQILRGLGDEHQERIALLDSKFWVWETLEEAVADKLLDLNKEDHSRVMNAFFNNFKGSENLQRDLETKQV